MKTIYDLLDLIAQEIRLNENKLLTYAFDINTQHMWVSMFRRVIINEESNEIEETNIFLNMNISTEHELQLTYWTIYNTGRSRHEGK